MKGYERALRNSGLCRRSDFIVDGDYTFKSGLHAGEQLLRLNSAPTAIFASNDEMAAGVMTAAMKRNLIVPDDISVAGFDDSPTATMIWPQLTTVRQPIDEMSKIAISMLVSQLRDREVASRETKVEYQLIVRDSTSSLKQSRVVHIVNSKSLHPRDEHQLSVSSRSLVLPLEEQMQLRDGAQSG